MIKQLIAKLLCPHSKDGESMWEEREILREWELGMENRYPRWIYKTYVCKLCERFKKIKL